MLFALAAACAAPAAAQDSYEADSGLIPIGGLVLFYNAQGPLSFQTSTRSEVPADAPRLGEVSGRGCQHGLSVPTSTSLRAANLSGAAGQGGYAKALRAIAAEHPDLAGIYDVKVDLHFVSILGLYRRACTEVTARAFGARH